MTTRIQDTGKPSDSSTITWKNEPSSSPFDPAEPAQATPNCTYYRQTQHNLFRGFQAYSNQYGGLTVFGYPLTEEFTEDGLTVQYFERARFEWHPDAWPERFDVELGRLGAQVLNARYGTEN
jgi:hypothetical protein